MESTVAVTRDTRSGVDILWIDRGFQGDTSPLGRRIPAALGTLPGDLLGRTPRRALAIGLGMGVTLSRISADSLEVAELSRGVIEANRTLLADVNSHVLERPGLTVHHADGRRVLADAPEPYDLIVTDMMFPTVAGAGNLYSREFYALARRRLTPGRALRALAARLSPGAGGPGRDRRRLPRVVPRGLGVDRLSRTRSG